jgi:hypothetical protein
MNTYKLDGRQSQKRFFGLVLDNAIFTKARACVGQFSKSFFGVVLISVVFTAVSLYMLPVPAWMSEHILVKRCDFYLVSGVDECGFPRVIGRSHDYSWIWQPCWLKDVPEQRMHNVRSGTCCCHF